MQFINDISFILSFMKRNNLPLHRHILYFRYNESGDFYSQKCVDKLNRISEFLKNRYDIITYGYSARSDLDFSNVHFLCKGSGHDNGNNGRTDVKKLTKEEKKLKTYNKYVVCRMDCRVCNYCKKPNNINILFPLH